MMEDTKDNQAWFMRGLKGLSLKRGWKKALQDLEKKHGKDTPVSEAISSEIGSGVPPQSETPPPKPPQGQPSEAPSE